ncbi:MAG TPA: chemotaxis protein CheW, partial [Nevskiaceae bacterium]|nr:chemotaxis protein CheW [Nevskiaceae bacterium]
QLGRADYNEFTVMIILNIARRVVGMVVDGVSDVLQLNPEQIRPAPEFGGAITTPGGGTAAPRINYITGIGTLDNRMLILVDIERLMSSADLALIDSQSLQ